MDTIAARTFEQKILFAGTQANYDALTNKDSTKLYFCIDTGKLFKGEVDFSEGVRVVSSLPTAGTAANGVLYIINDGGFQKACYTENNGTSYVDVALKWIQAIVDDPSESGYNGNSTVSVPTTKAVVDYVTSKVGNSGAVTSIVKHATDKAKVTYAVAGTTATTDVEIPGVVTLPTFDAATQILTLPVTAFGSTSAQNVEVDFGKYALVDDAEYDATTEKINFWTSNHKKADYPNDPAFSIDVAALITELAVDNTNSVDLSLVIDTEHPGASNHVLSANVNVATRTGVTNYLQVVAAGTDGSTVTTKGLLVDLTTIENSIANINTTITNLESALTTWGVIPSAT